MARSEQTLCGIVANRAESQPDFPVLTIEGAGVRADEVRTYRQLWDNGQRVAQLLTGLGVVPGERFAIVMANHPEFVELMIGASIAGAVCVPIDPRTRGEKLSFMFDNTRCKGVIAADYALENVCEARARAASVEWVIGLNTDEIERGPAAFPGVLDWSGVMPHEVPQLESRATPANALQIIFTSGTTGDPKGIVMSQERLCGAMVLAPLMVGYTTDDCLYSGLSLTHGNAQVITLGPALVLGLRCILSRRFTKSRLLDITRRYGCTTFTLLGGMTTAILANPARPDDGDNPVRLVVSAGMPAAIWNTFESRFNVNILEFYGCAEGGLTFRPVGCGPVGSMGKPVPGMQCRIVDEHGIDVAKGTPGELLFRPADGAPYTVEYFNNPAASQNKCRDGWLWTGDIVREDEDGWLFFEYRKGGGIRHNGDFINPGFVEKVIADCDNVDDVYVWGVEAASGAPGEKDVVASIVPGDVQAFDAQAIFRACRAELEANFVPTFVQMLREIPKTASEKPQDRHLLEMFDPHNETVFTEVRQP
ncbi:class I adenylate-forming enzyme family protein [Paraburkholderia sp. GAS334]|uniref:class I adenylate-forming enzyme family protein n=1 Tax=Paraburkholderia sp. GAS334 TaxID=3035131 RepID=UPI003D19B4E1